MHLQGGNMSMNRRSILRGFLACGCCAASGASFADTAGHGGGSAAGHAAHWSYQGEGGPEKWGELQADFKACQLGLEQTPIDLAGAIRGEVGSIEHVYKPIPLRILNNGHTIQVNADPGSTCAINGTRYELLQFHFHHPSEHLLAGKNFDMEVHFVHKASNGAIAVTGAFIRPGAVNAPLKALFDAMPAKEGPEARIDGLIDLAAVLPKTGGYYRYMGSLTTPPCSEGLTWTVFKEPIEASAAQIRGFAALFPNNARPVQQRNRRFLLDAS
jgi:carbonic anhydrase